jgi:hypothetical protein
MLPSTAPGEGSVNARHKAIQPSLYHHCPFPTTQTHGEKKLPVAALQMTAAGKQPGEHSVLQSTWRAA